MLIVICDNSQAEDKGVALTVAAYLDDEIHMPPPRYGVVYMNELTI